MATRDIEGRIVHVTGKPWVSGPVSARLKKVFGTAGDTHPSDTTETVTNDTGDFTLTVAVPASGSAEYEFTLPGGEKVTASLEQGDGSPIAFETLLAGG